MLVVVGCLHFGRRHTQRTLRKDAGSRRIALLGATSSTIVGLKALHFQTISKIVEDHLNTSQDAKKAEAFCFSCKMEHLKCDNLSDKLPDQTFLCRLSAANYSLFVIITCLQALPLAI